MNENNKSEKKSKEQVEAELRAETARRKANRVRRKTRRSARIKVLKGLGFRPNRKLSKDKRSGQKLPGSFQRGTATWVPSQQTTSEEVA